MTNNESMSSWHPMDTVPSDGRLIWISDGKSVWLGAAQADESLKSAKSTRPRYWMTVDVPAVPTFTRGDDSNHALTGLSEESVNNVVILRQIKR